MAVPLDWRPDQDAKLTALMNSLGQTVRQAAVQLGVSRSSVQRRAKLLAARKLRSSTSREREEAGDAPLPAGHPISWGALSAHFGASLAMNTAPLAIIGDAA